MAGKTVRNHRTGGLKASLPTGQQVQSPPDKSAQILSRHHVEENPSKSKKRKPFLRVYELVDLIRAYNPSVNEDLINRAYVYAMRAHGEQTRHSGDPYFAHPVEVAGLLTELKLDTHSVITGLLHDTVEDTGATLDEIENLFGKEVRYLVDGVTKLTHLEQTSPETKQAENLQKFFLATAKDVRVLLVKLCDRLHNMRTLDFVPKPATRERISLETLDIYGPLARRMGIHKICDELEGIAFGVLQPDAKRSVEKQLKNFEKSSEGQVEKIKKDLQEIMLENHLPGEVVSRQKSVYSIWRKLQKKAINFAQLSDIIAFRVILENESQCYTALGAIHKRWSFVPGHFKDYISTPKPNSYQSIHTSLLAHGGLRFEVQIRTREMNRVAEYGVAAHWRYKDQQYGLDSVAADRAAGGNPLQLLVDLGELAQQDGDAQEFLDHAKLEMYRDKVFTFSPKGKLVMLPVGATALDFAYAIHSQLGDQCVGVKINGKHAPLRTRLRNSDVVEILSSENAVPPDDALDLVVTGRARAAIRKHQKWLRRQDYAQLGERMIRAALRMDGNRFRDKSLHNLIEIFLERNVITSPDELYVKLGKGVLTIEEVLATLFPDQPLTSDQKRQLISDDKLGHFVDSREIDWQSVLKRCEICDPLIGEKITALREISDQGNEERQAKSSQQCVHSYIIHGSHCDLLGQHEDERWYPLQWSARALNYGLLATKIKLTGYDEPGALAMICNAVSEAHANLINITDIHRRDGMFEMSLEVETNDIRHLNHILAAIRSCVSVIEVVREIQTSDEGH